MRKLNYALNNFSYGMMRTGPRVWHPFPFRDGFRAWRGPDIDGKICLAIITDTLLPRDLEIDTQWWRLRRIEGGAQCFTRDDQPEPATCPLSLSRIVSLQKHFSAFHLYVDVCGAEAVVLFDGGHYAGFCWDDGGWRVSRGATALLAVTRRASAREALRAAARHGHTPEIRARALASLI